MRTSGKLLWRTAGLLSFLSFLLLATGFVLAMNPQQLAPATGTSPAESAKTPAPLPAEGVRKIVALGDSLTRGAGDANGQGYVGLVRQALEKKAGHSITFTNLAINGQESTDLLKQMSEAQVKTLIADADLILFTIGGNDLFRQTGGLYTIEQEKVAAAIDRLTTNYEEIIRQIRALNKKATIVYTSLYNPFGNTEAAVDTVQPVLDWNNSASQIAARYPQVFVVPTYDMFLRKEQSYLYTDHFHPNTEGYSRIAERIMQALE
ncbi:MULTISPECIES: GDSL-type esterase/lipase family protein [Brevibacillus]|jgi:lysophospholipase L1-like esterase|uniref:Lipase/acylhydrolase n=1 Tax=Brevibacillus parabrevis TaxID=54914 RepID=A0A4Y3PV74_BREPA|nr:MULTISPECIES: GDSL-type esterase/lipase family protein [Brevibacillus]MBU8715579.1 lysophospholipase [Brevibacillus parabrevis]MDH6352212.1 lysophospholipase L1-like esterase [Brevibacillus sp. 1238]MDR4998920.1 GDSL-type esterase/lipase family protein [Brevibacillus parabrevis]MED2254515.1 GDSL-type esterase/lipase family protein [Brevibacillus parabrevis]NRQ56132.1 lysophospholipase [Brevibacillus sp. HD1.4A]